MRVVSNQTGGRPATCVSRVRRVNIALFFYGEKVFFFTGKKASYILGCVSTKKKKGEEKKGRT